MIQHKRPLSSGKIGLLKRKINFAAVSDTKIMDQMGQIELEGMEFYACHGYYPSEKKIGAKFIVNLTITTDCEKAGRSDKLEDTLNYQKAYQLVKEEMAITSDLLEHVATRILDRLYHEIPEIKQAKVKISKMNPPMGGQIEKVSFTLSG